MIPRVRWPRAETARADHLDRSRDDPPSQQDGSRRPASAVPPGCANHDHAEPPSDSWMSRRSAPQPPRSAMPEGCRRLARRAARSCAPAGRRTTVSTRRRTSACLEALAEVEDEAFIAPVHAGPGRGAALLEQCEQQRGLDIARQARVSELELQRHAFDPERPVGVERDQPEQPEVVAQRRVDGVVVDEVAQVKQCALARALRDVRRVAGDRASLRRPRAPPRPCARALPALARMFGPQ